MESEIGSAGPPGGHNPPGRARRGDTLVGCASPGTPPQVVLGSSIFLLSHKNSPKSFVPFRELLFPHKNNTMVVLLKIASVRVSFIQIMQIRVQNKSKKVLGKVDTMETYQLP